MSQITSVETSDNSHVSRSKRSRNYSFTINNPTRAIEEALQSLSQSEQTKYVCYGRETAPSTGTKHLQGYIVFTSGCTFNSAKSRLPAGTHVQASRGSAEQNITYCSKDGDFVELGTRPQPGKKTSLLAAAEGIQSGELKLADIRRDDPALWVLRHRGLESLARGLHNKPRDPNVAPIVLWFHGGTGSGKSRMVHSLKQPIYTKMVGNKWFDGYEQQPIFLWDDFRYTKDIQYQFLLTLTDRYPMKVEHKGGSQEFNSPVIIFTCCREPTEEFGQIDENVGQFLRRLSGTFEFPLDETKKNTINNLINSVFSD